MGALTGVLESLNNSQANSEVEFVSTAFPVLCEALNIDQDHLFYEPLIGDRLRPDGKIAKESGTPPWAILEAKADSRHDIVERGKNQLREYLDASGAKYGVLITPEFVLALDRSGDVVATTSGAESFQELKEELSPINLDFYIGQPQSKEKSVSKVEGTYFELEIEEFEEALDQVDSAEGTNEKGDAFEYFAELLFGGIDFLRVRDRNLNTNTGEIDLVIEYTGHQQLTIFDDWGRFFLVECKNWQSSVGAAEVRNFKGKLDKAQVDMGVIFARNGLSGDEASNALRWIHDYFQREGQMILVVGDGEIEQLQEGTSFYKLLDESMYQRRFDT